MSLALAGCTAGTAQLAAGNLQAAASDPESGSWTVLMYSIADTNLEVPMMEDLAELASVGTQDGLNIVAMVDRAFGYTEEPVLGLPTWTGGKLLQIDRERGDRAGRPGRREHRRSRAPRPSSSATASTPTRPSTTRSIISDHGASWPGVGADESYGNDTLTLDELQEGIGDGLDGMAIDKLDMIGFDACLMATYEVASRLGAATPSGWWRRRSSSPATAGTTRRSTRSPTTAQATVDELGSAIIDGFRGQAVANGTDARDHPVQRRPDPDRRRSRTR